MQREPYAVAPIFLWQSAGPEPVYRHKALHDFYAVWEVKEVLPEIKSVGGLHLERVEESHRVVVLSGAGAAPCRSCFFRKS